MNDIQTLYVGHYEIVDGPTKKVLKEKGLVVSGFGRARGLERGAKGFFSKNGSGNGSQHHSLEEIAEDLMRRQKEYSENGTNTRYSIIPHHPSGEQVTQTTSLRCPEGEELSLKINYRPLSIKEFTYLQRKLN